jgi:biofilm protein TabA
MLSGSLELSNQPSWYPEPLGRMLKRLADPAVRTAPCGRIPVDGERMFIVVNEYETSPADRLDPESHRRYCDVQTVLAGDELMGWGLLDPARPLKGDYDAARDLQFYEGLDGLSWLRARPGLFFLFTPTDVHLPGVANERPTAVRKAVGKIHRELLDLA